MNRFRQAAALLVILLLTPVVSPALASPAAGSQSIPFAGAADRPSCGCACAPPAPQPQRTATVPGALPDRSLPDAVLPGTRGSAGGIRRIYPKNVLDHPDRAGIYALIAAEPGISAGGIAARQEFNRETLRYHLALLVSCRTVIAVRGQKTTHYFENHGKYSPLERSLLIQSRSRTAGAILSLIGSAPGITGAGIAARLEVSAPTVRWHLHRFVRDGIVTGVYNGSRRTGWSLTREAECLWQQGRARPHGIPGVQDAAGIAPTPGNNPGQFP